MKLLVSLSPSAYLWWTTVVAVLLLTTIFSSSSVVSAQAAALGPPTPNVERIEYMDTFEESESENATTTLVGFLAMPPGASSSSEPLPALVIIPYVVVV